MATATYNRANRVVRFDLSDAEVALIDAVIAVNGLTQIEGIFNNVLRDYHQRRREQEVVKIREKVDSLTDAQRQQILVILT